MGSHLTNGRRIINLVIIGCGKLGTAILIGIYKAQIEQPTRFSINIVATVRSKASKERLENVLSHLRAESSATEATCTITIQTQSDDFSSISQANIVILGCKPGSYESVCRDERFRRSLASSPGVALVSLVGGTPSDKVSAVLQDDGAPSTASLILVVRAIPNIAAQLRSSTTTLAIARRHRLSTEQLTSATHTINTVFEMVGTTMWVSEEIMDITSSIGSSAVALYAIIINHVAQSACAGKEATSLDVMTRITAQAAYGAAGLILHGMSPTAIIEQVATKGGSTQAGLDVLDAHHTQDSIAAAVTAMIKATKNLSGKLSTS